MKFAHKIDIDRRRPALLGVWAVAVACCLGCHRDMRDQPRYEPLEVSEFFSDGQSARPLIEGTIARGELHEDEGFYTGKVNGQFIKSLPLKVDRKLLLRGQQRFEIYCTPCHDRTGSGKGLIVQRGFEQPPSYHIDRLRQAPAGHFFDIISNGFDEMPRFSPQISADDRWAIVAYLRALQLSQHAQLSDASPEDQKRLRAELRTKEQP